MRYLTKELMYSDIFHNSHYIRFSNYQDYQKFIQKYEKGHKVQDYFRSIYCKEIMFAEEVGKIIFNENREIKKLSLEEFKQLQQLSKKCVQFSKEVGAKVYESHTQIKNTANKNIAELAGSMKYR